MINPFILKKYLALTVCGMLPLIAFYLSSSFYGLIYGIVFMLLALLLSFLISCKLLDNPFRSLIEGKGFLTLDWNSTGIIVPFITNINATEKKFIFGKIGKKPIEDIFDRNTVHQISEPITIKNAAQDKDGILTIRIDKKAYNEARFALHHLPVLIYNSQIESLITKDFVSNEEKKMFAEHTNLYLIQKVKQLIDTSTHFARGVVDLLKPSNEWLKSGWVWIIIVIGLIAVFALLGPKIISMIQNTASSGVLSSMTEPVGGLK